MQDTHDLLMLLKQAAVEAFEAQKPTAIIYGKVTSVSPLKISVEQKFTLTKTQLVLTKNVTSYQVNMVIDGVTKTVTVNNSLALNDEVIMLRVQGGQQYIVIDKSGG